MPKIWEVTFTISDSCDIEAETEEEAIELAKEIIPDPKWTDDCYVATEIEPKKEPGDYSHWNEEAELIRRAENPEISGADYPPDPYDDY